MASVKFTKARGVHSKPVAPYPSMGVMALINASFIKCYMTGTMPGSENSEMEQMVPVSVASQTSQGSWCSAEYSICPAYSGDTVESGKLDRGWDLNKGRAFQVLKAAGTQHMTV